MMNGMELDAAVPQAYERPYPARAGISGLEDFPLPVGFSGHGKHPLQFPEGGVDA